MAQRIAPRPHRAASRPVFEGLLSLTLLAAAFDWAQGADQPASAPATATDAGVRHDGSRYGHGPVFRHDCWYLPVNVSPRDRVADCTFAVTELWAGSPVVERPDPVRRSDQAICALPLPGRWLGDAKAAAPAEQLVPLPLGDVLASTNRVSPRSFPAGESPNAASLTGWAATPRPAANAVASVDDLW